MQRSRRTVLMLAAAACIVLGLSVRSFSDAAWTGSVGDGLYAVLIYLLLAAALPRAPRALIGLSAFAVCAAIELLQLTGIPAELIEVFSPLRWVLGSTFGVLDLLAYAVGCGAGALGDSLVRQRSSATR